MKQSAVDFLKKKLTYVFINDQGFNKLFEQAKAMEKEMVASAFEECKKRFVMNEFAREMGEQYYTETYQSK